MSDVAYRNFQPLPSRRMDWGAIWGGVFVFLGIWSVFAALGVAIFASISNPGVALTTSTGLSIWLVVLTIIAMFVAGRETGYLAGITNRHDGLVHGLMMFGLSVAGMAVLLNIGGRVLPGVAGVHNSYIVSTFVNIGWAGFVGLFLGWLAAMFGASSAVVRSTPAQAREIRPAA
jgi:hypothetical protein